ncbi:hypothetical protein BGX12_12155 [Fibrobacter sp. UWR4]|nr:hypothetical protein BGX12_12155 [Fibrobacter sp. UWR4]PZW61962.1 hypothetical protein C8E88_10686 [Fibrobacter sp. UWR1]
MRFLLVTLIYAILFFSDISMNFFEKILFGGIYVLCFLMEIWGIIINRKMGIFKMSKINKSSLDNTEER